MKMREISVSNLIILHSYIKRPWEDICDWLLFTVCPKSESQPSSHGRVLWLPSAVLALRGNMHCPTCWNSVFISRTTDIISCNSKMVHLSTHLPPPPPPPTLISLNVIKCRLMPSCGILRNTDYASDKCFWKFWHWSKISKVILLRNGSLTCL